MFEQAIYVRINYVVWSAKLRNIRIGKPEEPAWSNKMFFGSKSYRRYDITWNVAKTGSVRMISLGTAFQWNAPYMHFALKICKTRKKLNPIWSITFALLIRAIFEVGIRILKCSNDLQSERTINILKWSPSHRWQHIQSSSCNIAFSRRIKTFFHVFWEVSLMWSTLSHINRPSKS